MPWAANNGHPSSLAWQPEEGRNGRVWGRSGSTEGNNANNNTPLLSFFLLFGKRNVLPTGGILLNEECDPFVQVDKLVVLIYSFTKIYYTVHSFHESKKGENTHEIETLKM